MEFDGEGRKQEGRGKRDSQMLSSHGHTRHRRCHGRPVRRLITRLDDVVDEARQRRDAADEEGRDGAPIAAELGRVAIDAVEVVHVRHRHARASHDVVADSERKYASVHGGY